jgi:cyanophycinase
MGRQIVRHAGGPEAPILILPQTAESPAAKGRQMADWLAEAGARNVTVAAAVTRAGDPGLPALVEQIGKAAAVWIPGGDQNRFQGVFAGSPAVAAALREVVLRGGVVGGSSAGASLMGERMPTGDGDRTQLRLHAVATAAGLAVLPGTLIDTHLLMRERTQRLVTMTLSNPRLLGIGLDEEAWIDVDAASDAVTVGGGQVVVVRCASPVRSGPDKRMGAADIRMRVLLPGERLRLSELRRG